MDCTNGPRTPNGRCPRKPKQCSGNRSRVNGKCPSPPCKWGTLANGKCRGKPHPFVCASGATRDPPDYLCTKMKGNDGARSSSEDFAPTRRGVGKMRQINGKFSGLYSRRVVKSESSPPTSPEYSPNQSISTPDISPRYSPEYLPNQPISPLDNSMPRYSPKRPVRFTYSPNGRSSYSPNDPISLPRYSPKRPAYDGIGIPYSPNDPF
jgi:hypothetical protein